MRVLFLCVCVGLISLPAVSQHGSKYVIGIERIDLPPYYMAQNGHFKGYARTALDAFAKESGFTFSYKILPVRRVARYVRQGLVDAMFPDNPHWGHGALLHYSDPLFKSIDGLALRTGESVKNKKEWHLGVVKGFTLPPSLAQAVKTQRAHLIRSKNLKTLMLMLLKRRADAVYTNKANFLILAQQYHAQKDLMFEPFHKEPTGFSLSTLAHNELIHAFNGFLKDKSQALVHMKQEALKAHA